MAIKMRFLYFSKQAKMKALGELIKQEFDLTANYNAIDIIPPAYSCQKERLVILGISSKNDVDDVLRRFCSELNKERASNIAVVMDGNEATANKILDTLKAAGANVIPEVQYLPCGLFKSKITDEEKTTILAWIHDIIDNKLV
jgi:phosphomannomutase